MPVALINGVIEGKRISVADNPDDLDPLARRFWRTRRRSYYKAKEKQEINKIWGKRRAKKTFPKLDASHYNLDPLWPKAKAFCRHLRRHNPGLVELSYDQHQAALEAKQAQKEPDNA